METRLGYYKWHIIIAIVVIVCSLVIYNSVTSDKESDLSFVFVSTKYMNTQYFKDAKPELELLLKDVNHDSSRVADVKAFAEKSEGDVLKRLEECIASGKYDAYIADKQAFEQIKDKSVFEDASVYIPSNEKNEYLEDSGGRLYAVSLKDNSLAKRLGMIENDGLYIAVGVKTENGERTGKMKNAMNISGYIINSRDKYKM